jgi:hypothetical protein
LPRAKDLLLCAKHLFIAAIDGRGMRRPIGGAADSAPKAAALAAV